MTRTQLTDVERGILDMYVLGMTTQEIAAELAYSVPWVYQQVLSARIRLGAATIHQAVAMYVVEGLREVGMIA
jgi:DNA-binding CsgD family transcriptional regulator